MRVLGLNTKGAEISTEFNAGLSTFLAMMYIVPVNAAILSQSGMPFDALVTATAVMTIISTVLNGLWSNTPVAMSVGMGLNAYFSFGMVKGMGIPWQTGLGIIFVSGILYVIISVTPLRRWMIETIPMNLKRAVSAGIGAFIAFIGMKQMGLVVHSDATLVSLGDLHDPRLQLGLFSLVLTTILVLRGVKGAFVISIAIVTLFAWLVGISPVPDRIFSMPASMAPIAFKVDLVHALSLSFVPVILTFLLTDIFDTMGTLAGIGTRAGLFGKEHSVSLQRTIEADAAATVMSGLAGVSSTTAFIESAAGVEAGGRTGLTAVFTGLLFVSTLFMLPFFKAIPDSAIYPVLVIVGMLMFSELGQIDLSDKAAMVGSFFIVLMMPLTYSITDGLMFGSIMYALAKIFLGKVAEIEKAVWIFAISGIFLFFVL